MQTTLDNQLIYALGMVHFPRVPNMDKYVDKFMNLIRHDYPFDERFTSNILNAEVLSNGFHFNSQENIIWQFTSIDKKWGLILSDKSLCLHTASYNNFSCFNKRICFAIDALMNIPEINIEWITTIGFRFVNMFIQQEDEEQKSSIKLHQMLPEIFSNIDLKILDGIYVTRYKTDLGELRIQVLRNPPFTLTPDLNSHFIKKNGWVKERTCNEFVLIDLDNICIWSNPQKFDIKTISEVFDNLNKISEKNVSLVYSYKNS